MLADKSGYTVFVCHTVHGPKSSFISLPHQPPVFRHKYKQ